MTWRSIASVALSGVIGIALFAAFMAAGKIDLAGVGALLRTTHPEMLCVLTVFLGLNTVIAGEKWRLLERRLDRGTDEALPRPLYFSLTAFGVALGVLIPAPLSAPLSRSLGVHFHGGRAIERGAGATIVEQSYDVLVACFLAIAFGLLMLSGGGPLEWFLIAGMASVAGLLITDRTVRLVARRLPQAASFTGNRGCRLIGAIAGTTNPVFVDPELARHLFALSLVRFAILTLMAGATTAISGLDVPLWQLSAALPLVILATALPITPAGLGINEWTFASVLVALGTSFDIAAQWVLVNRLAVSLAGLAIGAAGALVSIAVRASRRLSQPA